MTPDGLRREETAAVAGSPSFTPFGILPVAGLADLREFGEQAERLEFPCIDVGGFIVPGRDLAETDPPGMETTDHAAVQRAAQWEQSPRQEAAPAAGARQRPPQAAPGSPPHAVNGGLTTLGLDLSELVAYHPLARVTASTETVAYLNLPLGLFRTLPIGARLTLEVPLAPRALLSGRLPMPEIPDVRAWAVWEGGPWHGTLITSHHTYPDQGICACMTGQWIRGVHPLLTYVAFCALWAAKALHERLLGFYPGTQHYPAAIRVQRDRPTEFCGCGSSRRYGECCRATDLAQPAHGRVREAYFARRQYLGELARQGRAPEPPVDLLRLGLAPR